MADERVLRLVLRDHLSRDLSSLRSADPKRDAPFMAEVVVRPPSYGIPMGSHVRMSADRVGKMNANPDAFLEGPDMRSDHS